MLTLSAGQVECLCDEVLPVETREPPEDLARLDRLLSDADQANELLRGDPTAYRKEQARAVIAAGEQAIEGGEAATGLRAPN